jgi:Ca2+-binding RTX toxin-like protein
VNTTTANDQKKPRISALANGGFIIVWTDNGALKAQRYTSTGSKTGGELTIRFSADSYGVAGLKDGGYVVFWTDGGGGVGTEAYARQYDANATAVTGEFSVNTYNVGGQQTYAATGLANGGYVILWISDAQDGSSLGVYGQKFTALGVKEDTEFLVNVRTMDAQTAPAVALLGNGFVATWSSEKQDGSDQGIYGRLFGDTGGGIIEGTSGPDNLTGTPGNDTINGKAGADVMTGLAGNDTYYVDNAGDSVVESPGEGTDLLRSTISYTLPANVEKLVLTGAASTNAIGNAQDNQLFGNAANNNLNGQAGADTMYGDAGDDTYYVDNAGDVVIERPDEGFDTVRSSVNHTLRPNVENLVLVGTATSGRGNALANRLTGNAANNTLNGGPGNDTLTGGTGQDRFLFDSILSVSRNVDRIIDFDVADDQIRLENEIFTALPATGTLPAAMFEAGAAATTSTTRIIYDPATGSVYYDADGNGKTKPAIRFARLPTGLAVTAADFVVQ